MKIFIVAIIVVLIISIYRKRQAGGSVDIDFTFCVNDLNKDEITNLKVDQSVNFWLKPETNTIFIYRSGTMGGVGRIGIVPNKYSRQIIKDLVHNRLHLGSILSISPSEVYIRYTRLSTKKVKKFQASYNKMRNIGLGQLLSKDYRPQNGFNISVDFKKDKTVNVNEKLNIKFEDKEYYIRNSQSLGLNFYNQDNVLVASKNNHPDKIRRILRAHFNDYNVIVEVYSIQKLDKYALKYYDRIPGMVKVEFEKNIT